MNKPSPLQGMRHLALFVTHLEICTDFYTRLLGMTIDWQPDADNVYLTSGTDNLALHRAPADFSPTGHQRLDHFGFFIPSREAVDEWHAWLTFNNVKTSAKPRDHRDGTRSFYCADPSDNQVQFIYVPTFPVSVGPENANRESKRFYPRSPDG